MQRAYDVLHDALLRFALLQRRESIAQPHAYLRTVARSVLADHYAAEQRWVMLGDDDPDPLLERHGACMGAAPALPEHMAMLNQRLQAVERLLACLPPRRREVFWLFRVEACSQREIATRLGLAPKTVENHVVRALLDLRAAEESLSS